MSSSFLWNEFESKYWKKFTAGEFVVHDSALYKTIRQKYHRNDDQFYNTLWNIYWSLSVCQLGYNKKHGRQVKPRLLATFGGKHIIIVIIINQHHRHHNHRHRHYNHSSCIVVWPCIHLYTGTRGGKVDFAQMCVCACECVKLFILKMYSCVGYVCRGMGAVAVAQLYKFHISVQRRSGRESPSTIYNSTYLFWVFFLWCSM